MPSDPRFEELLTEAESAPVQGWDFSWFAGRATEQRPSWGYANLISRRLAGVDAAVDLQTGGGEVLAGIACAPATLCATESWRPNLEIARRNLAPLGAQVVEVGDDQQLPFRSESFDLVVSRHPTVVLWDEIARVLRPGGSYLAQQIGVGSNRQLYEFLMGPQPHPDDDGTKRATAAAQAAGLVDVVVRHESLRVSFDDIAAIVVFLRKVLWTVPNFSVERYRSRLADLHQLIERDGPFISYSQRLLVNASKPA